MKLNEINIRDPFVFIENGKTYLYGTYGVNAWGGKALGFFVYVSSDGENYIEKQIFAPSPDFWSDIHYWAPELHKINGKYYLFASFYHEGMKRRSQLLVCDTPDGIFTPLQEPLTPAEWDCLDATYFEENGKRYVIFSHEWTQCKDGEMILAELDDKLQIKGSPKKLFCASEAAWVKEQDGCTFVTDGPFLYRLKSGKLLMLWSSHGYNGYSMGMAIADNIEGPWLQKETPLISSDGGHGMIFKKNEKIFITYHLPNYPNGAERPYFAEVKETLDGLELV